MGELVLPNDKKRELNKKTIIQTVIITVSTFFLTALFIEDFFEYVFEIIEVYLLFLGFAIFTYFVLYQYYKRKMLEKYGIEKAKEKKAKVRLNKEQRLQKVINRIENRPDFNGVIGFAQPDLSGSFYAVAYDIGRKILCVAYNDGKLAKLLKADDIIEFEKIDDSRIHTKTDYVSRKGNSNDMLNGALIGGLIGKGVGAMFGAYLGSQNTRMEPVQSIATDNSYHINIYTKESSIPIIRISDGSLAYIEQWYSYLLDMKSK